MSHFSFSVLLWLLLSLSVQAAHDSALRMMSAQHDAIRAQLELQFASDLRVLKSAARTQAEPAQRERATRTAHRNAASAKSDLCAARDAADALQHEVLLLKEENARLRLAATEAGVRAGAGAESSAAAASAAQQVQALAAENEALRGRFRQLALVSKGEVERLRALAQHLTELAVKAGVEPGQLMPAHLAPANASAAANPAAANSANVSTPHNGSASAVGAGASASMATGSKSAIVPPTPYVGITSPQTSRPRPGYAASATAAAASHNSGAYIAGSSNSSSGVGQLTKPSRTGQYYAGNGNGYNNSNDYEDDYGDDDNYSGDASNYNNGTHAYGYAAGVHGAAPQGALNVGDTLHRAALSQQQPQPAAHGHSAQQQQRRLSSTGTGAGAGFKAKAAGSGSGSRVSSPLMSARERARAVVDAKQKAGLSNSGTYSGGSSGGNSRPATSRLPAY